MNTKKYLPLILFFFSVIACCIAIRCCFCIKCTPPCNVEIEKDSNNLASVLATIAGTLATCAMFAWQYYDFNLKLKEKELYRKKEKILNLLNLLADERELIKISYPHIDNFWQEGKKPVKGGNAFRCLYVSAHILLKNINEKEYLPYVRDIAEQIYDECAEEIIKLQNCLDEEELNYAIQNYGHHKCQTIQRLYNEFFGLNERIHKVNHYKPEEEKKKVCAYLILKRYEIQILKYQELLCCLSQNVQQLFKYYNKENFEDVSEYIKYSFSVSERILIKEFFGKQNALLSDLAKLL